MQNIIPGHKSAKEIVYIPGILAFLGEILFKVRIIAAAAAAAAVGVAAAAAAAAAAVTTCVAATLTLLLLITILLLLLLEEHFDDTSAKLGVLIHTYTYDTNKYVYVSTKGIPSFLTCHSSVRE